jgi:glycine oxidase
MNERVVVIGGGVIGASIAWRLARAGADVVVLEDRARAGAATLAAGGMLAPLAEAHAPGAFLDLGLDSLHRWPDFVAELEAETGLAVGYARAGKLIAALSAAEADDLAAAHAWQPRAGLTGTEVLDGAHARGLEPALSPEVRAAVLIHDDHRVDNVALAEALERAARLAGARWLSSCATRLVTAGDRVSGIETAEREPVEADVVVLAAGAWSGQLAGLPRALPVRPVRGQMLALRPARPTFGRTLAGAACYIVPRPDGRVVVGSTMEEAGYDATTTPDGLANLRTAAVRLVPSLGDAARAGAWAGLRPATPDELPILGREPDVHGLVYATGHFRNGILLAPLTADAIAATILGTSDVDLSAYSAARFEGAAAGQSGGHQKRTPRVAQPEHSETDRTCDLCGAQMYEVHCKLVCPACGYKRDCSDLW